MHTRTYDRLQESLVHEQLDNGLHVFILPKPGFHKTYATFSTKYGSVDNHFALPGREPVKVPNGIAHFLEHKMFEEPTGDIFAQFASQGASANAFTSFDKTTYLFTATDRIHANLETLLHFVQNPYFTDENVDKEKGIIGQEITMYQDNPGWRSYFGLIEAMYQVHPVHIDIAGSVASISQINKELLYQCYETFYHPSNMMLFVVGGIDPEETMMLIRDNQAKREYAPQGAITRMFDEEPKAVKMRRNVIQLPVSLPKCMLGLKEAKVGFTGTGLLERELEMRLLLDLLFSSSSAIFEKLYEEDLISDSFGADYQCSEQYAFSMIGGDTKDPERLVRRIQEEVTLTMEQGIAEKDFERSRRKKIGAYLRMLNSPEAIANEFTKYRFKQIDFFEMLTAYESMTFERIEARLKEHFDWSQLAVSMVEGGER